MQRTPKRTDVLLLNCVSVDGSETSWWRQHGSDDISDVSDEAKVGMVDWLGSGQADDASVWATDIKSGLVGRVDYKSRSDPS